MIADAWLMLADYVSRGGLIMLPLVLVSLVMWGAILYCLLRTQEYYARNIPVQQAGEWLRCGQIPATHGYNGITTHLVRMFMQQRTGNPIFDRYVLDEVVRVVSRDLERGLTLIGVLAAIAPLLGLLGTVLGMIGTFDTIALFGTGNARAMAGGISQALITTQTGLLIAIPGLYMRNFLCRRAANLHQRLESLVIYLKRQLMTLEQEVE